MSTNKSGEPRACPECQGTDLQTEIKAIDGGVASEYVVYCNACKTDLGFYAYGAWDPNYFRVITTH